ncbi:juvenile hormone esterase-like [Epargyreus clarus]|uniref:juvenile hormone esterase-like n=1 Tax=Epargyreus clarus TaxID=520877 RepID=UPI003C2C9EBC
MTSSGLVRGKLNKYKTMEYYSYLGIPFAESPTGTLRFMPPIPRKPWSNVLDATQEGPVCAQMVGRYQIHQMSEDCLNINIYVPASGVTRLLPVAVVVHGGGLQYLSGNSDYLYGPQLGPLGFLSLDIKEASGNAALKDVILSLKWIQENIRNFRGNPNNVTIIGHSSGAVIAHYLMLTEKSKGLFQQVIFLSGSAVTPRAFARHPKHIALALARELGLNTDNMYEILKHLRKIDVHEMLRACANLGKYDYSLFRQFAAFVPSKEIESSHAVITVDPVLFFRNNNKLPINVAIMTGISADEGVTMAPTIMKSLRTVKKLREHPENCIPSNIEYPLGSEKSLELGRSIGEFYFGKEKTVKWIDLVEDVARIASDTQYIYAIYYWINKFKSVQEYSPLYFYIFDFDGDLNWCKLNYNINMPGTVHSDEMGYLFITNATKTKFDKADARSQRMANILLNLMSNFIFYGYDY